MTKPTEQQSTFKPSARGSFSVFLAPFGEEELAEFRAWVENCKSPSVTQFNYRALLANIDRLQARVNELTVQRDAEIARYHREIGSQFVTFGLADSALTHLFGANQDDHDACNWPHWEDFCDECTCGWDDFVQRAQFWQAEHSAKPQFHGEEKD